MDCQMDDSRVMLVEHLPSTQYVEPRLRQFFSLKITVLGELCCIVLL